MTRTPTPTPAHTHTSPRTRRSVLRSWRTLTVPVPDACEVLGPLRKLVVANLLDWGVEPQRTEEIELAVSELVTNALLYAGGPVLLQVKMRSGAVHLEVSDTSTHPAHPAQASLDGERGRGLHIVTALAYATSIRIHAWGKTIAASFEAGFERP